MGIAVGLLLGIGVFLCLMSGAAPAARRQGPAARLQWLLDEAGSRSLRPMHLLLISAGSAVVAAAAVLIISRTWSIAVVFGAFGASAPWILLRRRALRRQRELR